ncbi:hypothetical protein BY996DRAFT_6411296 [Phakopsora pachyrhizi]|nr:hypothetical protein BY996DRAFT_6411296 [Phakopsora pachyrhizi]
MQKLYILLLFSIIKLCSSGLIGFEAERINNPNTWKTVGEIHEITPTELSRQITAGSPIIISDFHKTLIGDEKDPNQWKRLKKLMTKVTEHTRFVIISRGFSEKMIENLAHLNGLSIFQGMGSIFYHDGQYIELFPNVFGEFNFIKRKIIEPVLTNDVKWYKIIEKSLRFDFNEKFDANVPSNRAKQIKKNIAEEIQRRIGLAREEEEPVIKLEWKVDHVPGKGSVRLLPSNCDKLDLLKYYLEKIQAENPNLISLGNGAEDEALHGFVNNQKHFENDVFESVLVRKPDEKDPNPLNLMYRVVNNQNYFILSFSHRHNISNTIAIKKCTQPAKHLPSVFSTNNYAQTFYSSKKF